jgi:hypothetical protein
MRIEGDAPGAALDFSAWQQGVRCSWPGSSTPPNSSAALMAAVRFAPHVTCRLARRTSRPPCWCWPKGASATPRAPWACRMTAAGLWPPRCRRPAVSTDRPHAGLARQWFRSPDVLALLPFDRPQPGHSYGLVWSVPDERGAD